MLPVDGGQVKSVWAKSDVKNGGAKPDIKGALSQMLTFKNS